MEKISDAPDIILATLAGHFVLVECKTSMLRSDKPSKLHGRAVATRASLVNIGHEYGRVRTAAVTTKSPKKIAADIELAENLEILELTREDMEAWIAWSMLLSDPDAVFARGEESVRAAKSKFGPRNFLELA